jgi:hypothetical protein
MFRDAPYEAFSMLHPLTICPSVDSRAAPTRNLEYGLYDISLAASFQYELHARCMQRTFDTRFDNPFPVFHGDTPGLR